VAKMTGKMDLKITNPERRGFPGMLKFWLPKYITKSVTVMSVNELDSERKRDANK